MSTSVAIIGTGNIGTDLLLKITRLSRDLRVAAVAGIDPESDGLAAARELGITTTDCGVDGLLALPELTDVALIFDATSARAHVRNAEAVLATGRRMIDLTPAALGPFVVPPVNLEAHLDAPDINLVTCGGQATTPVVAAVASVTPVAYAEIVASIAARSAGPGTRANIDEFTRTTARALEVVGRAGRGKAIIVLDPADPPMTMHDTVYCLLEHDRPLDRQAVETAVTKMVERVRVYVPGYRLKQAVQFDEVTEPWVPALARPFTGTRVTVFLEVTGAGHALPAYAGNLDIMTSAALHTAERLVACCHPLAGAR